MGIKKLSEQVEYNWAGTTVRVRLNEKLSLTFTMRDQLAWSPEVGNHWLPAQTAQFAKAADAAVKAGTATKETLNALVTEFHGGLTGWSEW